MPVVAEQYTYVVGVDTHARTHTYAVVEASTGRLLAREQFPVNAAGIDRALGWIARLKISPLSFAVAAARVPSDCLVRPLPGRSSQGSRRQFPTLRCTAAPSPARDASSTA